VSVCTLLNAGKKERAYARSSKGKRQKATWPLPITEREKKEKHARERSIPILNEQARGVGNDAHCGSKNYLPLPRREEIPTPSYFLLI